jgi:outer membrane receptor protein involved in Fe transport
MIRFLLLPVTLCSFFTCSVAQTLTGTVKDQNMRPVGGAKVSVISSSINQETRTNSEGRFELNRPQQNFSIRVEREGFAVEERELTSVDSEIVFTLRPATLLEDVTVVATRRPVRLGEQAASVVVLSDSDLESTGSLTVDDMLRQVPGFTLFRRSGARTANPTSQGVSLRGVGASGASRALVVYDDIPVNDPFGGWVYWSRIPKAAVDRVEVLRGGASDLYGSPALSGAIDIRGPENDFPVLEIETSMGNQTTPFFSLFSGVERSNWSAHLAAEGFHTDGYILVDENVRGAVDRPAVSEHGTINLRVDRRISDKHSAFLGGSYFKEERENGTFLQDNQTRTRELKAGWDFQSQRAGAYKARAYLLTQVYDQIFSAVSVDRNSETITRLQRVPSQATGFLFQYTAPYFRSQNIVAGMDARQVRGASNEIVYVAGSPTSLLGAGGRENSIGLYVSDHIRLHPRLFMTLGARIDHWSNVDAARMSRSLSTSISTTTTFADRSENAFSPRGSIMVQAIRNLSISGSVYRGFRAPTLNELYRSFRVGDVLTNANENLRAERLTGSDLGFIFSDLWRKMDLRTTFFWMEMTRPVANVTLTTTPTLITRQRQNLGRTRSRGVEIDLEIPLASSFSITTGYAFTDARVLEFPTSPLLVGLQLPQVPRNQFTIQSNYKTRNFTVGLQGRFSGLQFDDDQNRFQLDRFFTLDGFVSRRLHRYVQAFLAAENIFDQEYEVGRTPIRTLGPPALFRAGIRLQVGNR